MNLKSLLMNQLPDKSTLINGIIDRLIKINKDYGITLLVIEHNMKVIMSLPKVFFSTGKLLAEGSPDQIKNDKQSLMLI